MSMWENTWTTVVFVAALILMCYGTLFLLSDHAPVSYYVSHKQYESDPTKPSVCVYANQPYYTDDAVACFQTVEEAVQAKERLNSSLKQK